jgi:hypothetical protein
MKDLLNAARQRSFLDHVVESVITRIPRASRQFYLANGYRTRYWMARCSKPVVSIRITSDSILTFGGRFCVGVSCFRLAFWGILATAGRLRLVVSCATAWSYLDGVYNGVGLFTARPVGASIETLAAGCLCWKPFNRVQAKRLKLGSCASNPSPHVHTGHSMNRRISCVRSCCSSSLACQMWRQLQQIVLGQAEQDTGNVFGWNKASWYFSQSVSKSASQSEH